MRLERERLFFSSLPAGGPFTFNSFSITMSQLIMDTPFYVNLANFHNMKATQFMVTVPRK